MSLTNVLAQTETAYTKNIFYLGGGRQGLTYMKYERMLIYKSHSQTIINIGLGGIPGDGENGIHRTTRIVPEVGQLFGYKFLFLELGIEPSINFFGKITYVDLNGIVGLRYQTRTKQAQGLFFQIGYNPKIYYTYKSDIEVPVYFGMGLNF